MSKIVRRVIALFLLVCLVCLTTTGCCIQHKWVKATCTEPKHCEKCNKTEGEPLGHNWEEATCTKPKTCTRCHTTKGDALGHKPGNWELSDDGENEVKKCSVCGEIVEERHFNSDGTVTGFINSYNTGLSAFVSEGGLSNIGYQSLKLDYDAINDDGDIDLIDGISIELNPNSEREQNSKLKIANFIVKDITSANTEWVSFAFLSYLYAIDSDFVTGGNLDAIREYATMASSSAPIIPGYEINNLSIGELMCFQIKIQ